MLGDRTSVKLGPFVEHQKGYAFKSSEYESVGHPIVRVSNFTQHSIDMSSVYFISPKRVSEYERFKLRKGDVVIATVGSWPTNPASVVGKTIAVPANADGALLNQNAVILRAKGKLDQTFLFYLLKDLNFQTYLVSKAQGSANQASITLEDIFGFEFILPSQSEQKAIAHILGTLDDKIELNRKMNETLEMMARALFKSWFIDLDPVRAKMAGRWKKGQSLPGLPAELWDLFPDSLLSTDLGLVPDGWNFKSVSEIVSFNPTESLGKGADAPYLDMAALPTQGSWPDRWIRRPFGSGMKFRNGDTLLARITPCLENGKSAYVQSLPENEVGWGSTEYIVMRAIPPVPEPTTYLLARHPEFREQAKRSMTGTSGRQRAQADMVSQFQIACPRDEQVWTNFKDHIVPMFQAIKANSEMSLELEEMRNALLPKLISGSLCIQDAAKFLKERGL